jgi:plasmid stabilization system protein ParE
VSLPVVVRPEASRDMEEARDYIDSQRAGSGQAFLDRMKEALDRISALPEMYSVVARNVRAARLRQFTYVVYYRVHDDQVEVLAVMHGSRDASAWQAQA